MRVLRHRFNGNFSTSFMLEHNIDRSPDVGMKGTLPPAAYGDHSLF